MDLGEPIRKMTIVPLKHDIPASAPDRDIPVEPGKAPAPRRELEPVER